VLLVRERKVQCDVEGGCGVGATRSAMVGGGG